MPERTNHLERVHRLDRASGRERTSRPVAEGAVVVPRPVAEPRMRVFLLHHAAGTHRVFADWVAHFPGDWEVCLLEAPGRRRLARVPAPRDIASLAAFFLDCAAPRLDRPYALFGHSMGAAVGYEMVRRLPPDAGPMPTWLGVSACRPPGTAADRARPDPPLHRLPDRELRAALAQFGALPDRALADGVWPRLAPRVRSDFRLVEQWRPPAGAARTAVPLSVFGGLDDPVVTPRHLAEWADLTRCPAGRHLFPGGHFYFQRQPGAVTARVVREIRRFC